MSPRRTKHEGGAALLITVLLLSLGSTAVSLAYPLFAQFLIDEVILGERSDLLGPVALLLVVAGFVSHGLGVLTRVLHAKVSVRVLFELRRRVLLAIHTMPLRVLSKLRRGDLLSRLGGDVAEVQGVITDGALRGLSVLCRG